MKNEKLIIYGVGKLAEYAAYVFQNDSNYDVLGFCIEQNYINSHPEIDPDIIPFENLKDRYSISEINLFIAVGNNVIRERVYRSAKEKGYNFGTYISSKASSWENLVVGENCFIGEGSIIQAFVKIGNNCILFGARLGHHTVVGDHVLLSGPTIGGNVRVGDYSFIGLNSVVLQNLEIGSKNIIGMGVAIKTSTGEGEVYSSPNFTKRKVSFDDISNNYLN